MSAPCAVCLSIVNAHPNFIKQIMQIAPGLLTNDFPALPPSFFFLPRLQMNCPLLSVSLFHLPLCFLLIHSNNSVDDIYMLLAKDT